MSKKQKKNVRKGIAALIYCENVRGKNEFLLLKRKLNWKGWEWCKGGIKKGENEFEAVEREMKEETGRKSGFVIKKTPFVQSFDYEKEFVKDKTGFLGARNFVFLVRFLDKKVKPDKKEHSNCGWFDKKDVLKKIAWPDQKKIFEQVIRKYKI